MSSILVVLVIIMVSVITIIYTAWRLLKGLGYAIKCARKGIKFRFKRMWRA